MQSDDIKHTTLDCPINMYVPYSNFDSNVLLPVKCDYHTERGQTKRLYKPLAWRKLSDTVVGIVVFQAHVYICHVWKSKFYLVNNIILKHNREKNSYICMLKYH